MTQYTHPRDIDEFADQIPDKYLACRVDYHSRVASSWAAIADVVDNFDPDFYSEVVAEGAYKVKTLRCRNRCGIVWMQVIDKTGAVLWESGPQYNRAPGYLTKGLGRFTKEMRDRLRLEQAERAEEKGQ